jgi:hypothetical protein
MTKNEQSVIETLTNEVRGCREVVQDLVQKVVTQTESCKHCRGDVERMAADIYGLPGNKEASPGLMGDVAELRRSRKLILLALRGAWVLLTILLGAVATAVLRACL